MNRSDQLTFALVGVGGISQSQHLPNLQRAPHIHLKTICDLQPDLLKAVSERYGIRSATCSFEEVLADPGIEAVLVATRPESHAHLVIEALNAGKHVYVEKPLADTEEECRKVQAAKAATGRELAVAFNRRMAPAYQLARKILRASGGAYNLHYRIADAFHIWGKASGLSPGSRVLHEVCHIFDLLRFLTESEIVTLHCLTSRHDDEAMLLQFANGCVATILSSGYATYDMPKEHLEVMTELGSLTVSDYVELRTFGLEGFQPIYRFAGHTHPDRDHTHRYLFEKGGEEMMLTLRKVHYEAWKRASTSPDHHHYLQHHAPSLNYMMNKGWLESVDHFAHSILQGQPSQLATVEDGLKATRLCEAAVRSREERRCIHLQPA
ncbi:MAG TPA: Gfo/Idh/MocA family oxidoreductase [Chthoniobacteraceae bacterium]|nr:Gfo/Idh/MocA family oxidoreductase [Chthoniobacteraceae bacterium]